MNYKKRITVDPNIMVGKPVITGTRIPVELILTKLAQKMNVHEILKDYPRLTEEDIRAAILYASDLLKIEEVYPIKAA